MIADMRSYVKSPANQFAAKLATGAGNYDDLQNWSYWVMDNWQAGVSQKDADAGGSLYSELESRYPNELRLPRPLTFAYHLSGTYENGFAGSTAVPTDEITIGTTQAVHRLARRIYCTAAAPRIYVKLWLPHDNNCTTVKVAIYSDSAGSPNAQVFSNTFDLDPKIGYGDYIVPMVYSTSATTYYHIVILPYNDGETLRVPISTTGTSNLFFTYNGSTWASTTTSAFIHEVRGYFSADNQTHAIKFFTAYDKLIGGMENAIRAENTDLNGWTTLSTLASGDITDLLELGDTMVVGQGNVRALSTIDSVGTVTGGSVSANRLAYWNGYVWRSDANEVYYSADMVTWTGPIEVCASGFQVRGMAGLGDHLYVSCDDGLYYIGYGDFVFRVTSWGGVDSTNGEHMINYHGNLIIGVGESIFQFDGQTMLPIGLDLKEGIPANYSGTVAALVANNNWLYCAITSSSTQGQDTIWAYNDQGWHFIAALPPKPYGPTILSMCYQRDAKQLHIGTNFGHVYSVYAPDVARESTLASVYGRYKHYGWLETDWFYGGLKEVQKDFESVYVSGENFSATQYAEIYWQDDDSTDWELLGTVTSDRQELRWSNYTTRPNSRQIKIGIAMYGESLTASPMIHAVRVKYHPMVSDWFRWSFPILVSDRQQEIDHTISSYSAYEKRLHLDSLITQVPPFILQDIDGETQYEVKVMGCQIQASNYEWINGSPEFDSIYNITVEQVRNGTYEA